MYSTIINWTPFQESHIPLSISITTIAARIFKSIPKITICTMLRCMGAGALDVAALNSSWIGGESVREAATWRRRSPGLNIEPSLLRCIASSSRGEVKQQENRGEGSFQVLMVPPMATVGKSTNITWAGYMVKREERQRMLKQKGCVIWITGLSGSGKSTLACTLDHALLERGRLSYVLDGDNLRHGLNNNLGFNADDRAENIRRLGEVAKLFADASVICIASFISPYKRDRELCRRLMAPGDFIEAFMDVKLDDCEQRDPKGLYKLARAGKIKGFMGIDDPYEYPEDPEIVMTARVYGEYALPQKMAVLMLAYLEENGFLSGT